jgi:MFS transporter, PPP family, 3-phenylpropionic acid transporter
MTQLPASTTHPIHGIAGRDGLLPVAAFYFVYFAFIGVFFTYCGLLLKSRGFSAGEISVLITATQLVRIFATPGWGSLADHRHQRMPIVRVTFIGATAIFTLNFVQLPFWAVLIVFAGMSALWSAAMPLFEASVLARLSGRDGPDMGRFGRIRVWGSLGYIVIVMASGTFFDYVAIERLVPLVAVLMALLVIVTYWVPEAMPPAPAGPRGSIWPVLALPGMKPLFVCAFLNSASQGASFVFYSIYMVENGHSKTIVGVLWSIGVVAEVLLFLVLAKVIARFGYQTLWRAGFVASTLRYLIVAAVPGSFVWQAVAQTVHMLTFGTHHTTALAVIHRVFRGSLAVRGQALYAALSFALGSTVGGLLAGWMWESLGPRATFLGSALIAAIAAAVALSTRLPDAFTTEPTATAR